MSGLFGFIVVVAILLAITSSKKKQRQNQKPVDPLAEMFRNLKNSSENLEHPYAPPPQRASGQQMRMDTAQTPPQPQVFWPPEEPVRSTMQERDTQATAFRPKQADKPQQAGKHQPAQVSRGIKNAGHFTQIDSQMDGLENHECDLRPMEHLKKTEQRRSSQPELLRELFSSRDEAVKAVIYSEIMTPKF